jgi:hypothetical protein
MLTINQKYKVNILPKKELNNNVEENQYNKNIVNGKGINELISKVKDIKIKELNKIKNSKKKTILKNAFQKRNQRDWGYTPKI